MISLILEFICCQITKTFGLSEGAVILRYQKKKQSKAKSCSWCWKLPLTNQYILTVHALLGML